MTPRAPVLGWFGAATTAAALLTGATALAITALPPRPLMLDLGQSPPAAPALAAIAEAAPQVVDEAPALDSPPVSPPPVSPPPVLRPPVPLAVPLPETLPKPDLQTRADLALPSQDPSPTLRPKPAAPAPSPAPERLKKPPKAKPAASQGLAAPQQGQKAKGGTAKVSPAAYAKAVMKKVRATKKKSGAGKGVAVVGFTVAANGGLAGVKVIRSSGNAALDQIAVSHIQRAAPFPAPPAGVGRSFSFEFIGR